MDRHHCVTNKDRDRLRDIYKYRYLAVSVFAVLTLHGPESRAKLQTTKKISHYKPKKWVLVFPGSHFLVTLPPQIARETCIDTKKEDCLFLLHEFCIFHYICHIKDVSPLENQRSLQFRNPFKSWRFGKLGVQRE